MSAWISTVTNAGTALLALMAAGETLTITRAVSGSSSVSADELKEQTQINNIVQNLTLQPLVISNGTVKIPVFLENTNVSTAYSLWQIGLYASHPNGGEILFAIAQATSKEDIPTAAESPGFSIEWNFNFANSNDVNFNVVLDTAGIPSFSAVSNMIESKKGAAGGIASLDNTGKIPEEQLPDFPVLSVRIPVDGWSDSFPYENTVSVSGVKAADEYTIIGVSIPADSTESSVKLINKTFGLLMQNENGISDGTITFKASKIPTISLTVSLLKV